MFAAVVEAAEEAVVNSLCAADTVSGAHGHTVHGLPLDEVQALLRAAGRLRARLTTRGGDGGDRVLQQPRPRCPPGRAG